MVNSPESLLSCVLANSDDLHTRVVRGVSGKDAFDVCPHSKDGATQDVVVSVTKTNLARRRVTTLALSGGRGRWKKL